MPIYIKRKYVNATIYYHGLSTKKKHEMNTILYIFVMYFQMFVLF